MLDITTQKDGNKRENRTLDERNAVVVEHLPCIETVMRRNYSLIEAAHLDWDDVYQQLAVRLIRAVDTFDPNKGKLRGHIFSQLKYELLNCKRPYRMNGMTGLPTDYRGRCLSLDSLVEAGVAV